MRCHTMWSYFKNVLGYQEVQFDTLCLTSEAGPSTPLSLLEGFASGVGCFFPIPQLLVL